MGKTKKKNLSEKVRSKKREPAKKINPFEVKINRQKHDVLGRKISKRDRGMPGLARSKAIKRRKETLLVEYKKRGKANLLVDRRIGEGDPDMTPEDKMVKRFAAERMRHSTKTDLFSLNEEEEELTHYGQNLSEIEKFKDPIVSDSDEDDEDRGKISAKMVGEEHFGGGFFTKKEEGSSGQKTLSWKERMEELIAQSKKNKFEHQAEREKTIELTEQLDEEWKDLRELMTAGSKLQKTEDEPARQIDDFDITVRELKFEMKGLATDRLKTEEEIAKEEKERLEKLEADRIQRMKGLVDKDTMRQKSHRSADDLDDDYMMDVGETEQYQVRYKDGQLVTDDPDEENSEDEDGELEQGDGDDQFEDDEEGEDEEGSSEESDDAMEHTSDLESEEGESGDEAPMEEHGMMDNKQGGKESQTGESSAEGAQKKQDFKKLLLDRKKVMEAARKELPYTFKAPEDFDELLELLAGHSEAEQIIIIERVRKCHHPSLAEGNKEKLERLFPLLVEYYGNLATQDPPQLSMMDRLVPHLYELVQLSPLSAGLSLLTTLQQTQREFSEHLAERGKGVFPSLDVLMLLKLVSVLFPTSDFRHPVVTPAMLFMSQIITQCPVNTRRDIASGLFVCNLFLEYVTLSQRFVPEVINFLCGVLFLASDKQSNKVEPVIPPFKPVGRSINLLELQGDNTRDIAVNPLKISDVFARSRFRYLNTDEFRLGSTAQCSRLLIKFSRLYADLPCYREIFAPVKHFSQNLPVHRYPDALQELHGALMSLLDSQPAARRRHWLVLERKKPQPLKLFEPQVDESFDGRKRRKVDKKTSEKQRLEHKYKREMKGAIREIRKDNYFLAEQKLKERLERDAERKQKVKRIYQMLSTQEGEFKALQREKDKMSK